MTARLIDGTQIAREIRAQIQVQVEALRPRIGRAPGLATVLVGENPASHAYVRSKRKACREAGMESIHQELPRDCSEAELLERIAQLADDPAVDGILVQLPLPQELDEEKVLAAIPVHKDVDGFHPINIGRLGMKGREPWFVPCTPKGVLELLRRSGARFDGARAVVLGRSNIVGLPVALLLLKENATVVICHSRTRELAALCREADILIAAIGRPRMVGADMVKPGAFVIDVGINRIEDPSAKHGSRLVGDVDFEAVSEIAGALTPVPGGVGPMTIAMLLQNTLDAYRRSAQ
ncbi:MAG TPA: bifunctional methylenetetrahydrofolate dehydrogenase/methenyltetrahydrofolate cyclohydrolase FolD [Acidobacteriota bacterium]